MRSIMSTHYLDCYFKMFLRTSELPFLWYSVSAVSQQALADELSFKVLPTFRESCFRVLLDLNPHFSAVLPHTQFRMNRHVHFVARHQLCNLLGIYKGHTNI